jgi:hypothetical protein
MGPTYPSFAPAFVDAQHGNIAPVYASMCALLTHNDTNGLGGQTIAWVCLSICNISEILAETTRSNSRGRIGVAWIAGRKWG